jgi:hypothetical protein
MMVCAASGMMILIAGRKLDKEMVGEAPIRVKFNLSHF